MATGDLNPWTIPGLYPWVHTHNLEDGNRCSSVHLDEKEAGERGTLTYSWATSEQKLS